MAQSPVLYALIRKRAELAGEIEEAEQALSVPHQKLQHIDGALAVFGYDLAKPIKPKRKAQPTLFQNGEVVRFVLHTLRVEGPKTVPELRDAIMAHKGLSPDARRLVHKKILKTLERQKMRGTVTDESGDSQVRWEVVG